MIKFVAMAVPLLLPVLGFVAGLRLSKGRLAWGVGGSALAGFATGAFFGSAAGAMATAVTSAEAFWKGGAIGTAAGAVVGAGLALLVWGWRLSRRGG